MVYIYCIIALIILIDITLHPTTIGLDEMEQSESIYMYDCRCGQVFRVSFFIDKVLMDKCIDQSRRARCWISSY